MRNSFLNSLAQICDILEVVNRLPNEQAGLFYVEHKAGKHVRHMLDHLLAFLAIGDDDVLDYNKRNRESEVEVSWGAAKLQLDAIMQAIENHPLASKDIHVVSEIDVASTTQARFKSNTNREILYLINHTMHHVAYIKLLADIDNIKLPDHIGLAPSTASYERSLSSTCAR